MTEVVKLVETNPVVFVNKIVENIQNGFYVTSTMAGYPVMGQVNYITLFEVAEPAVIHPMDAEIEEVVVSGYEIMRWLLDVQDMVVQGFVPMPTGTLVDNFKTIKLHRAKAVSLDGLIASESATEAPKAKRQTKPKSIQKGE